MPARTSLAVAMVAALSAFAACKREAAPTPANANGDYRVEVWPLPAAAGSSSPDLSQASGDRLLLSWMNRQEGRRNALQFSSYTDAGGWQSQPRTIAVGQSLMVSWADGQHLRATPDGALWVQWLQTSPGGPHAREVVLARSRDGGMTWQQMTRVSPRDSQAEHGFVSMWTAGVDRLGIAWLDGAEPASDGGHGGHGGATMLHGAEYDLELQRGAQQAIDAMSCDCCRTDVALTDKGPLLVWRDRGEGEVRDIAVARFTGSAWTAPKPVHADGWKVEACPLNGPAVAARGNDAVVAWYSEAGGEPAVRLARSTDAGDAFAAPVLVEQGKPVLGQVDVAVDVQQAWVAWLREDASGQTLMLARYAPDLSKQLQRIEVAKLQGRGHASGTPQLAVDDGGAWLVWTDASDGVAHLQGARITR